MRTKQEIKERIDEVQHWHEMLVKTFGEFHIVSLYVKKELLLLQWVIGE